jgi:antitoxin component of MazEF toxin-antitoxin module
VIIKTSKWGASIGIRLPIAIAEELEIKVGDYLRIELNERYEMVLWLAKDDVPITSVADVEQSGASATQWHEEDVLDTPEGW